jgi:hypothetical protein
VLDLSGLSIREGIVEVRVKLFASDLSHGAPWRRLRSRT